MHVVIIFAGKSLLSLAPSTFAAFHSVVSNCEKNIVDDQTVLFDLISPNIGDGYHSINGVFISPTHGLYVFSVSIATKLSSSSHDISAKLVKNVLILGVVIGYREGHRHI